jgi:putative SOS response-associated peptidase YedK
MCNRFENKISYWEYTDRLNKTKTPLVYPKPDRAPNLEPRDIRITNQAPILRSVDGGLELKEMRWGLIPWYWNKPVKEFKLATWNARTDNVQKSGAFQSAFREKRCLVPASAFYEHTGTKTPKTRWRFTVKDDDWFCLAGLWDKATTPDGDVESFTFLMTESAEFVKKYHDRQPVILKRDEYHSWLTDAKFAVELLGRKPDISLQVEKVPLTAAGKNPE